MCLNLGFDQSFSPRLDYGQPTTVLQSVKEPFHSGLLLNHQRSSSSSSSATVEHNHRVTIIDCVDYIIIQLWLQFFCERSIRYSLHINGFNGYAEIIIIIPLDYYNRSHSSRPSSIASPRGIHHSPILYIYWCWSKCHWPKRRTDRGRVVLCMNAQQQTQAPSGCP